jgi:hypothetical protein
MPTTGTHHHVCVCRNDHTAALQIRLKNSLAKIHYVVNCRSACCLQQVRLSWPKATYAVGWGTMKESMIRKEQSLKHARRYAWTYTRVAAIKTTVRSVRIRREESSPNKPVESTDGPSYSRLLQAPSRVHRGVPPCCATDRDRACMHGPVRGAMPPTTGPTFFAHAGHNTCTHATNLHLLWSTLVKS